MTRRPAAAATIGLVALLAGVCRAEAEGATPQRPSLSFNTSTVPGGRFEIETGAQLAPHLATLPVFGKYGLTDRVELEIGFDAIRRIHRDDTIATSRGDLTLGARVRAGQAASATSFAVAGWVKIPAARELAGSGEPDAGLVGILSRSLGAFSLDANLWVTALGQGGGGSVVQTQGVVTLGIPGGDGWSSYVEAAWQQTATAGGGGFADAGLAWTIGRRMVLDTAAGAGWRDGYPDWVATSGVTILLGPGS